MTGYPQSAGDDVALAEDLGEEFARFVVGPAPVEAVLSHGRAIKARRRATLVSGLAVAAVLGVSAVAVRGAGHRDASPPVSPDRSTGRVSVTVDPPHQGANGLPVFSGSVDGKPWSVAAGTLGGSRPCLLMTPTSCASFPVPQHLLDVTSTSIHPGADSQVIMSFRADAARADVEFGDHTKVSLIPAALSDARIALMSVPSDDPMTRITVYGADGHEVGFTVPYNPPQPHGILELVSTWYQPGEEPPTAAGSEIVAEAADGGARASVTAAVGPFGTCVTFVTANSADTNCEPAVSPAGAPDPTSGIARASQLVRSAPQYLSVWYVDAHVPEGADHTVFTFDAGRTQTARVVTVAGHRFVAVLIPAGGHITGIATYRSDGTLLGSS